MLQVNWSILRPVLSLSEPTWVQKMTAYEMALRLGLSFVFGSVIGIERQWHHKTAGLKTNALVTVGACAFALIVSNELGQSVLLSQVAGGIVTGIGFIGGGVILRHGNSVQGVNSAATLWATASIGMGLGLGRYEIPILVFAIVLIIQFVLRWVSNYIDKYSGSTITPRTCGIQVVSDLSGIEQVRTLWSAYANRSEISTIDYRESQLDASQIKLEATFSITGKPGEGITELGQSLSRIPGVIHSECSLKSDIENN
jgi:uncharacterized membrane protein YhiD involved in acid resistance